MKKFNFSKLAAALAASAMILSAAFTGCSSSSSGGGDGGEGTIESVSITSSAADEAVDSGTEVTLTAAVTGDISAENVTYTWEIAENPGNLTATLSAESGNPVNLTVTNEDESAHKIKVKVTASNKNDSENSKTAEVSVTVKGKNGSEDVPEEEKKSEENQNPAEETKTPVLGSVSISGTQKIASNGTGNLTAAAKGTNLENASINYSWTIADGGDYAEISGNGASATIKGKNTTTSEQIVKVKVTAKVGETPVTSEEYSVTVAAQKTGDVSVNVTLNDETQYITVKFVDSTENGNETKTYKVKSGEKVTDKIPDWKKEGSLLVWTSSVEEVTTESEITQDVTFTASWSSAHTVIFKDTSAYEGDTVKDDVPVEVADGATIDASKIPNWTKTHYTLSWKNGDTEVDVSAITSAKVTADVTYTAVWTEDAKFTVIFTDSDSSNGNEDVTQNVYSGEKASVPNWTKENYTLSWSSSVDGVTANDAITQDVTFTANWTEKPKCTNCSTHYATQAEADACSKQSGCPNYGKVTTITFSGTKAASVASDNTSITVSVTGNIKSGVSLTYNNKTYSSTLKMESSTAITISGAAGKKVTVVMDAAGKKIKYGTGKNDNVSGTAPSATETIGVATFTAPAGDSFTISKGDSVNVGVIFIE